MVSYKSFIFYGGSTLRIRSDSIIATVSLPSTLDIYVAGCEQPFHVSPAKSDTVENYVKMIWDDEEESEVN